MPSLARQAWNLARSLADFVADGCKTVTREQYQARLEVCDSCEHRRSNRCMKCGCRLSLKAQGRAFKCPEGKVVSHRIRLRNFDVPVAAQEVDARSAFSIQSQIRKFRIQETNNDHQSLQVLQ